ncbi:MAG: hypothetical protein B5M52_00945, partial [Helicobacteraceae bacterium 4484_230]
VVKSSHLSASSCHRILNEKKTWIFRQLAKAKERPEHDLGRTIRIFGELKQLNETTLAKYIRRFVQIDKERIRKYYFSFYKEMSMEYIPKRVDYFSRQMNLYPSEIRFRRMKRRWGSCSSRGAITFNTLLMQLSKEKIDYVIVHELAHLKHMNHSAEFHKLVEMILPDSKNIHLKLRDENILA